MKLRNKLLMLLSIGMAIFLLAACSDNNDAEQTEDEAEVQNEEGQEGASEETDGEENKAPANKLSSDEDLQTQLAAEEGIEDVMVQVVEGEQNAVNVDIQIAANQDPEEAFEKYGKMIKEKYPDQTIDLIIVQDGQLVKQDQL